MAYRPYTDLQGREEAINSLLGAINGPLLWENYISRAKGHWMAFLGRYSGLYGLQAIPRTYRAVKRL